MKKIKKNKGFTLIELMVSLSIISLLSSIVTTTVIEAKNKARNAHHIQNLKEIQLAIEQYAIDHDGKYPIPKPGTDGVYMTNDTTFGQFGTLSGAGVYSSSSPEWIPGLISGGYIKELPVYIPYSKTPHMGSYGCSPIPSDNAPCNPSNAYTYDYVCTDRKPVYFYRSDNGTGYKLIVRCPEGAVYANGPVDKVRPWTRYSVCGFNSQSKYAPGKQNGSGGANNIACDGF